MRHFKKKLKSSFFSELQSYIDTYTHIKYSAEHTKCVEQAFDAIDDYYEESYALGDAEVKATPPMCAPTASGFETPKQRSILEQTADLSDITRILKQPSFADNLFKIIDDKGFKDSRVYKKADIDRRLFSKIRSDSTYHPSKETAIKLCLALELDVAQTERLLETAGYCLSMSSTSDLVIRYCIEHNEFNIINVNEALAEKYALIGNTEKAIEHLTLGAKAAKAFDERSDEQKFSSLLLGERLSKRTDFETSDTRTLCEIMRDKWLENDYQFESIKNLLEFKNVIKLLSYKNSGL